MADLKQTFDILHSAGYELTVKKTGKNSCKVHVPGLKNKLVDEPELDIHYKLTQKGVDRAFEQENIPISVPKYASRVFILADIVRISQILNYNPELVGNYDEKNAYMYMGVDRLDVFGQLKGKVQLEKEGRLFETYMLAYWYDFDQEVESVAADEGVLDGYQAIRKVLTNE